MSAYFNTKYQPFILVLLEWKLYGQRQIPQNSDYQVRHRKWGHLLCWITAPWVKQMTSPFGLATTAHYLQNHYCILEFFRSLKCDNKTILMHNYYLLHFLYLLIKYFVSNDDQFYFTLRRMCCFFYFFFCRMGKINLLICPTHFLAVETALIVSSVSHNI